MQSKANYQVVLLGGPGVGKTLLMYQFAAYPLDPKSLVPTEEYETLTATRQVDGNEETFKISTISGKKMVDMCNYDVVKTADAVIFVLDINEYKTLLDTEIYFYELQQTGRKIPTFFVANKNDVPNDAKFPFKEVQELGGQLNINKCYLTSGLDSSDLLRVFSDMSEILKKEYTSSFSKSNLNKASGADRSNNSGDNKSCKVF
jgi:small GTP-binding protein